MRWLPYALAVIGGLLVGAAVSLAVPQPARPRVFIAGSEWVQFHDLKGDLVFVKVANIAVIRRDVLRDGKYDKYEISTTGGGTFTISESVKEIGELLQVKEP